PHARPGQAASRRGAVGAGLPAAGVRGTLRMRVVETDGQPSPAPATASHTRRRTAGCGDVQLLRRHAAAVAHACRLRAFGQRLAGQGKPAPPPRPHGSHPLNANAPRAVAIALLSALFFTLTYVLNRAVVSGGGHWQWAVILRYLITLPLLAAVLPFQGGL